MFKRLKAIDWETTGVMIAVPFWLLYDVTIGWGIGWLQSTFCTGPEWKWYGPIPIRKRFDKWDRANA